jgi:hypothetical protein
MTTRFFATSAASLILGACAGTPPPTAPTNLAAAPVAAAAPAPTAAATNDDHRKMLAKKARELDYIVEKRNGQLDYCLTSAQLGTRFKTKGCLSEADFEDVVRRSAELQTNMHQPSSCSGPGCVHN